MTHEEQMIHDAATGDNWRYRALRAEIERLRADLAEAIAFADAAIHPDQQYHDARPRLLRAYEQSGEQTK